MNPLPWDDRWYAWRLDREVYSETWDSGLGSKRDGGRWNTPGRRVVYASVDPSTAILEVAAHGSFDALDQEPYVLTCFEIVNEASGRIVQPEDVPNPHWLNPIKTSPTSESLPMRCWPNTLLYWCLRWQRGTRGICW